MKNEFSNRNSVNAAYMARVFDMKGASARNERKKWARIKRKQEKKVFQNHLAQLPY